MTLNELKNALYRSAKLYSQNIGWAYSSFNHTIRTKRGWVIPTPEEIDNILIDLINSLKPGDESVTTAGIEIELLIDEDNPDNYVGGYFKYCTELAELTKELDVTAEEKSSYEPTGEIEDGNE